MIADPDQLYHRLFSHPLMVEGLVREFVPEAMALDLDFARMERVNAKFHAGGGRRREGDVIWRLPTTDGTDLYLYILLEFQSAIVRWMAVRVQVYTGLLWQHLIKEQRLKNVDSLPPVLPIVLYNGDQRWNAPADLAELIALPAQSPLWPWQPRMRYYLLDEGAFPQDDLVRRQSLTALLFRLEHCHDPGNLVALIDEAVDWFRRHPDADTLRTLFTEIVQQAAEGFRDRGTAVPVPQDMQEVRSMLATRMQAWARRVQAEALAQGETVGMAKGKAEGKAETLLRQLARRFKSLPADIEARVRAAGADQVDEWLDRILDAQTLDDVFGAGPRH